jgi:OOP family OmpA-OmpF porin
MNKNTTIVAAAVLCFAVARSAAANEVGFYIGGYVGQASKQVPRLPFDELTDALHQVSIFTPVEERTSLDDKDTAFALIGGYRWNRYFALEASYARLGKVIYKSLATGDFPFDSGFLNTTIESETSGFTFSVLGVLPLTRDWELFARGGALFANDQLRFSVVAQGEEFIPPIGNNVSASLSKSRTETYAGLGISWRILEIYDLRLEYQRVFDAGEEITGGKGDIDAALLGLTVTF